MRRFKESLVAFGGLSLLVGAVALVTPRPTRGQVEETVGPPKPVTVVNPPAEPVPGRDVDHPARQPFQKVAAFPASFTVPGGKRLVIEFISARVSFPEPCGMSSLALLTVIGGETVFYFFPGTAVTPSPLAQTLVFNQQTRMYADPETVVRIDGERSCSAGGTPDDFIGHASISGYLVDVP